MYGRDVLLALVGATIVATPRLSLAYGESDEEGRPSRQERRLHLLTNQVRAAPHDFPGWDTSLASPNPRPPLSLDGDLFEAARFHADDMATTTGCFQHASCDGTSMASRIRRFFAGGAFGENIALGQQDERAAIVAWMNSTTGHRENILSPSWNVLGTGASPGLYWVQNFGQRGRNASHRIMGAADFPTAGRLVLKAHAFDLAQRVPERFEAHLGDEVLPMSPGPGRTGHRIWEVEADMPDACEDVVFFLQDFGDPTVHRYPTTGALQVGPGCTESFSAGPVAPAPGRVILDADESEAGGCRCASRSGQSPWVGFGLGLLLFASRRRPKFARDCR